MELEELIEIVEKEKTKELTIKSFLDLLKVIARVNELELAETESDDEDYYNQLVGKHKATQEILELVNKLNYATN